MSRSITRCTTVGALVATGVTGGALMFSGSALAAYPPAEPQCSVASSSNSPGAAVTISGVGFVPGSTVTVGGSGAAVINAATTIANADGSVRVVEKLGKSGKAQYTLSGTATNAACGAIAVRAVPTVQPSTISRTTAPAPAPTRPAPVTPAPKTRVLAFTGAQGVGVASVVGLGLLGAGVGLVVASRRRRSQA